MLFYAKAADNDPDLSNNNVSIATTVNAPPGLSIGNAWVKEGDNGTTNAVFTVRLFPPTGRTVTVDYGTADSSALAGADYTAVQGTVTLTPGDSAATVLVPVLGDTLMEPDETFTVSLRNPVNAPLALEQTTGTGTILDDDYPTLSVDDVSVVEPAQGSTSAVFTLRLSAPLLRSARVDYGTGDGTAHAPDDYLPTAGSVTLAPGATATTVEVPILADALSESEETLFLNLTNISGVKLERRQARATIVDNNAASLPRLTISGAAVPEGQARTTTNAVFNLTLSRPSAQPVQVDYQTANGTALGGNDFVIAAGTVTFSPGQTSAAIAIIINGDDAPEHLRELLC